MITAAISTLLGLFGGVLPDIMKEVRDSRNASREIEHMRLQADLQIMVAKSTADSKLREIEGNIFVEEARAFREHLGAILEAQGKSTGIKWVDAFNALLRPVCVTIVMIMFLITAIPFVWHVLALASAGTIDAKTMAEIIWGSLVGESVLAVMGFLFGYRSSAKRPGAV